MNRRRVRLLRRMDGRAGSSEREKTREMTQPWTKTHSTPADVEEAPKSHEHAQSIWMVSLHAIAAGQLLRQRRRECDGTAAKLDLRRFTRLSALSNG